jgi:hypothetical protein
MSDLLNKQQEFSRMVVKLINLANELGYELTFGDAYRDPRCPYGSEVSFHHKRLAIDLNLFRDGQWLKKTEDHRPLGEYWESLGGTWGGRWGDGNHYSLGEGVDE